MGLGEARQLVPTPESPIYPGDEYAYKYIEYDMDLANQMLDSIGLDQKDADGIRLMANADQVTINIAAVPAFGPWVDVAELVASYWQDVGINALIDVQERSLHYERIMNVCGRANELQVAVWK